MKTRKTKKQRAFKPAFALPSPCEMQTAAMTHRIRGLELENIRLKAHIDGLEHALRAMSTPLP